MALKAGCIKVALGQVHALHRARPLLGFGILRRSASGIPAVVNFTVRAG
jgi:hypothetical protein